jgi:hypothetical protein
MMSYAGCCDSRQRLGIAVAPVSLQETRPGSGML